MGAMIGNSRNDNPRMEIADIIKGAVVVQDEAASGQLGAILLTNTTAVTGNFRAILALDDTAFATLTSDITKNGNSSPAVAADFGTLYQGNVIYGKFTAVALASGKVILYK